MMKGEFTRLFLIILYTKNWLLIIKIILIWYFMVQCSTLGVIKILFKGNIIFLDICYS